MHENVITHPKVAFDRAVSLLSFFIECSNTPVLKLHTSGCWQPPELGFFKLNTDGAIFDNLQAVGLGAVLRDSSGDIVIAASMKENTTLPPETAECLAILRGLQHRLPLGINNLIVESV